MSFADWIKFADGMSVKLLAPRRAGGLVAESLRAIARAAEGGPETFCEIAK